MRCEAENHQAWDAWKKAQANAEQVHTSTQLDPNRLSILTAERIRRAKAATYELRTADAWRSSTKKRRDLIGEHDDATRSIRYAEKDAARHRILLPWILKQVPLIEAESDQTDAVQHEPDTAKGAKKKLHSNEDSSWEQDTKKRKLSCSSLSLRSDRGAAVAAKSKQMHKHVFVEGGNESQDGSRRLQAKATSVMPSSQILANHEMVRKGPRRSAGIAARQTTA